MQHISLWKFQGLDELQSWKLNDVCQDCNEGSNDSRYQYCSCSKYQSKVWSLYWSDCNKIQGLKVAHQSAIVLRNLEQSSLSAFLTMSTVLGCPSSHRMCARRCRLRGDRWSVKVWMASKVLEITMGLCSARAGPKSKGKDPRSPAAQCFAEYTLWYWHCHGTHEYLIGSEESS